MSRTQSSSRTIARRDFLRDSAATIAGVSALKSLSALGKQEISPNTDYSSVVKDINQMLPVARAQKDITGASIALVDGEHILWCEGFGYTDRSRKVKVTADTLFHVGSISKSFTALGVLKAADKGLLTLDDPLKKHLSWFTINSRSDEAEAEKIMIRHL